MRRTERYGVDDYELFLYKPDITPPPEGFPIIYVLDGNAYFHTVADIVSLQARRREKTGVVPAIVCAVGYPGGLPFHPRRFWDYTPKKDSLNMPKRPNGLPWPESGGAEDFLHTLEEIIKPFVEARFPVNRLEQTLFGHSLGGLFTVYALFAKPDAYQNYMAISPSLWWNRPLMQGLEQDFLTESEVIAKRLFLAVGSEEKEHIRQDAEDLYERLQDSGKIRAAFIETPGENHISVVPTVLSKALRYINRTYG